MADAVKAGVDNKPVRVREQTNNIWQNKTKGFYFGVVDKMPQMGFSEKEISKIGAENFLRIFDSATKK